MKPAGEPPSHARHSLRLAGLVGLLGLACCRTAVRVDLEEFAGERPPLAGVLPDLVLDRSYWVRCAVSLPVALALWASLAAAVSHAFPRHLGTRGVRPPVFGLRLDSDVGVTLAGLLAGTPMIQLFHHASDKYAGASGMLLYQDPWRYGLSWAVLQVPVYLLLWDLTFYVLHRWLLHHPLLYQHLHAKHHAFRPPTAWSGIAVDPLDVVFEGILPYTVPLFVGRCAGLPFHEYTVNAVNALLTLHALVLHSACHRRYDELSPFLGWLMISPIGHNMHHQYGERNACNFAPIFQIWDRLGGTLNEAEPFWWKSDREAKAAKAAKARE